MAVMVIMGMVARMCVVMICVHICIAPEIFKCLSPEQASDERAQQWQEENCLNHLG